jgi:hypothetical protein
MNPIELNAWLAREILVHEGALRGYLSRFFKSVADVEDGSESQRRIDIKNIP